jgi:hypothetical protein
MSIPYDRTSRQYGFEVKNRARLSRRVSTTQGRNMREQQPESYEAPTVEEIEIDGKPIAIALGVSS